MGTLIAVGQMTSTEHKLDNLETCEALIAKAAKMGAKFLSLPENFAFMGHKDGDLHAAAESVEGPSIMRLKACAKLNALWLSLGGFQELIPGSKKIYNSHIVISDQGELVANYRKMNLFSVTLPDGSRYDESAVAQAGEEVACVETPFFIGGLSICFDVRFAALFGALRKRGAQVMLIPAAFTHVTGPAHWEVLLRARAIETQSYVVAAAQVGQNTPHRKTHGHAMIIDPWGKVIASCGDNQDLAYAEIDLAYLMKIRELMPMQN